MLQLACIGDFFTCHGKNSKAKRNIPWGKLSRHPHNASLQKNQKNHHRWVAYCLPAENSPCWGLAFHHLKDSVPGSWSCWCLQGNATAMLLQYHGGAGASDVDQQHVYLINRDNFSVKIPLQGIIPWDPPSLASQFNPRLYLWLQQNSASNWMWVLTCKFIPSSSFNISSLTICTSNTISAFCLMGCKLLNAF